MMTHPPQIRFGPAPSGAGFRLEATQYLPQSRDRVFAFFSDAFQLQALTPGWLHFSVVTPQPIEMKNGTILDYRLRVHGLPMRWQSRISDWEPPLRFVDEQTRGPYRRWRHEHSFEPLGATGTLCRDVVDYEVPGGLIINAVFVRRDLRNIFQFRQAELSRFFPETVHD